jgi:rubrerythrin
MKRPFSSLSPQEALHVSVFIEERNAELYHRFAEMFAEFRDVDSLEIASVFWDMAAEERRHGTILLKRYSDLYGNRACAITDDDIQEMIELPKLEDGDVFEPVNNNARESALQVALNAEQHARDFYVSLGARTSDAPLKKLYTELGEFEDAHVAFLERKIAEHAKQKER